MGLEGKRIIVFAEDMYEDPELWYPYYRMIEAGAEVRIVGSGTASSYNSKHGYPAKVHASADEISANEVDAVIIPGGFAPDRLRRYPAVLNLVRDAFNQGKVVASICHGPWVMVSAGVLKGRKATSVLAIKDDVVNAGATWIDQEVVVDGNLITSRTPADLPAFCRTIIAVLEGEKVPVGARHQHA
jgi:protease I